MLPDPEWRPEDQPRVQARTSGGSDNNDNDQSGDMPSWMLKETSGREETKKSASKKRDSKRNQPSPRKTNTPELLLARTMPLRH